MQGFSLDKTKNSARLSVDPHWRGETGGAMNPTPPAEVSLYSLIVFVQAVTKQPKCIKTDCGRKLAVDEAILIDIFPGSSVPRFVICRRCFGNLGFKMSCVVLDGARLPLKFVIPLKPLEPAPTE